MDFFSTAWSWFKGSSLTSSLAKTALLGYASRLLNKTTEPTTAGGNEIVDKGVRLQLNPSTENEIPVLYGEAYFGGYITDAQLSTDYKKMTYCLTLAELTGDKLSTGLGTGYTFQGVYLNNNRVVFKADGFTVDYTLDPSGNQDISFRDLVKIYFYCDQTGVQPIGSSGTTPSPFTTMPGWSSLTHSMEDLMYSIVEITYNKDRGVSGLPECIFHAKSDMVLPGDVLADYMTNTVYGAGIPGAEVDGTSLLALNTFAGTGFSYTNLSAQTVSSPIHINGLVDVKTDVLTNMQALAEAASSWLTYDIHTGTWKIIINKAGTAVANFTDSNIIGEISISGTSLTQLSNIADVKYQNTDIQDKTDFVKISIPSEDLYTNEPETSLQLSLPFTNKQVVAAKIGLQALKQARVDKIIAFQADYSYIMLGAGDIISVTSAAYGFTSKLFRIITVTQSEGDLGEILLDFTALEYDSTVYDYDITEYAVESDGGILGIGSIGTPNVPVVTKTEQSNVPKIVIDAVVPSGIVEAVEFWITFDVGVSNDSARTYIQIGTYRNTNGSNLSEDDTVSYTYTQLAQSDFFVKVRGVNGITSGPYSSPTGLIEYVPIVVADTVSDNPPSIGGQLMQLGLLTLLNNLDKLFSGDTSPGGVFDKIFKGFEEKTGVDLVGSAQGGNLVVPGEVGVLDDGTQLTSVTRNINFVGDGVSVTAANNEVTVTIGASSGGGTPEQGGLPATCYLTVSNLYPVDKATGAGSYPEYDADKAPISGYYAIKFSGDIYSSLEKGTGNIKLYKSNGTLVETLTASQLVIDKNLVKLPFADRTKGTDYYILMDQGVVKTPLGCVNPAITTGTTWNFNTPWEVPTPYLIVGDAPTIPVECGSIQYQSFAVNSKFSGEETTKAARHTNIAITFNRGISLTNVGQIKVLKSAGGTHQIIDLAQTFNANKVSELVYTSGSTLYVNPTIDMDPGVGYYIIYDAGVVTDPCGNKNVAFTSTTGISFTVDGGPSTGSITAPGATDTKASMTFDRPVVPGTGNAVLYDGNNNVVTTIASSGGPVSYTPGVA